MRIVAITNLKGGVGKTTTTVSLGAGLSLRGQRVLLVDVDAQGNLAMALGVQPRRTLYEVLVDGKPAADCLTAARPNLDLLASDEHLLGAQPLMAQRADWAHLLGRALKLLAPRYDVALIDCSPSMSMINASALLCATDVVVPTLLEHLALRGIQMLDRQLARLGGARISCIVPTMFDGRQRQAHLLLEQLRREYGALVTAPIRVNVRLSEAPAHGRTIYEHDSRSRGAADYAGLVEHLALRLRLPEPQRAESLSRAAMPEKRYSAMSVKREEPAAQAPAPDRCPRCDTSLRQTMLAGYRVRYCPQCHYQHQELAQGIRR